MLKHFSIKDLSNEDLRAAIQGFVIQAGEILFKLTQLVEALGDDSGSRPLLARKKRHAISSEGRARIAEAQRRRWAKQRRAAAQ
jgi:hypothetical protein